ncbi:MAG: DHH family phosphoesterase [Patescibacteria group bacterium]|nr:DHH family phosphoesterase [Patescibacteria group bacterium]
MEIKNLKKVSKRILKAIKDKEKIILYGDNDLDGAGSVIILKETITTLGGKVSALYFPDREIEGYGITEKALGKLKEFSPALLITVDCGIGNFKEIELAKELGFYVIVIDHHKILDKLPGADIVVDPKQPSEIYSFQDFATVGIVFRLSKLLFENKMGKGLKTSFLELVALATIADMMPQIDENKLFIEEGLSTIEQSLRPGIRALFATELLKDYSLREKVSKVISILNVRDVKDGLPVPFRILTNPDFEEVRAMIPELLEKTKRKKLDIRNIVDNIKKEALKSDSPIIFKGNESLDFAIISPIASLLCNYFKKPVFIYKKFETESQGTVRSTSDIDSVVLMGKCKDYVITYGGHARASGFRLKNENLEKFKNCLIENALKYEKDNNIY